MRRLMSVVAVVAMVLMMLPVLACAADTSPSRMEMDCCKQMHGKCGDMAKQGCCRVEIHINLNQLPSQMRIGPLAPAALVAIAYPRLSDLSPAAGYRWRVPNEHSPPARLITDTTVFRI